MRILLFSFFLLISAISFSQEDLTVSIRDEAGQALAGVAVRLVNAARGYDLVRETNTEGRAIFFSLPVVDGYQVVVPPFGAFMEARSGWIDFRSNLDQTVELVLVEERSVSLNEIVVRGNASGRINRKDAEVSFELTQKEIEVLPIEGRDITRVLFRLPNVSQATGFYPEAPNVSINGANPLFTSYLIDGLDNNERFLGGQKFAIPVGFAKDVTVLTNNYSAEYGLTSNGVVNITTRSGSNNPTGEVFVITRPGPVIDGKSEFAQRDLSGNLVKDGFQRYQAGFGAGGALRPGKTFYYLNAEHTSDLKDNRLSSPQLGVNEVVRGENRFTYLSGKLDHHWSRKFRSTLRTNIGRVTIERQGGGLEGGVIFPSAGNFQDRNSLLVATQNTYVGRQFTAETNLQYARFRWNYGRPLTDGRSQVTLWDPSQQTVAVIGHPGYIFDETESTVQFLQKFKWYSDQHTLKGGIGVISSDHSLTGGGNVAGNYLVQLSEMQLTALRESGIGAALTPRDLPGNVSVISYNVELRPASFGKRQNIYSVYLEDQWAVSDRLNLTLGLRYDYDDLSKGGGTRGDANNLAPRFNFNYRLGNRSVIRGGYGIFYDKILYAVYSDALQQNTTSSDYRAQLQALIDQGILPADTDLDRITFDGNLTATLTNVPYLDGPGPADLAARRGDIFSNERRILNPLGFDNPFTHQIALGFQHQFSERLSFLGDLVHNRSQNLFRLRNLNAAAPFLNNDPDNVQIRTVEEADLSRPVPIFEGSYAIVNGQRLDGVARNVVMSETEGESRFFGASLNIQQEPGSGNFAWRFIYTLSFLENNTEDINFRAMDGNAFAEEWGPSINDRRHIFNGMVTWFPVRSLGLSLAGLVQSGQPVNRIPDAAQFGTADLNGDGASFGDAYVGNSDRYPGESRNSDRLPWSEVFDLGLQYDFDLGDAKLEFRADVFNILNTQNLSGYSNNATQSNQIQVGPAGSSVVQRNAGAPRQFQFGLRYYW